MSAGSAGAGLARLPRRLLRLVRLVMRPVFDDQPGASLATSPIVAAGRRRFRPLFENVGRALRPRVFVLALDQEPVLVLVARPPLHPHEMPAPLELLAHEARIRDGPWRGPCAGRRLASMCRDPRRGPRRRRIRLSGSCPRTNHSRADGPRPRPRAASRRGRGSGRASPPSSSGRHPVRAGNRSGAAARHASARRSCRRPWLS